MKNKKLLNILILLFSLVTLVTDILLFAFPAYTADTTTFLKVMFWILNSFALIFIVTTIIVSLISLFMNEYICSKVVETSALLVFVLSFINVLIYASTGYTLSFGYILVAILSFVTANISQIARLLHSTPTWVASFKTLLKLDTPKTIIDATNTKEEVSEVESNVESEEKPKQNKIIIKQYDDSNN